MELAMISDQNAIVSLSILKSNMDYARKDYLDMLLPFVKHVLYMTEEASLSSLDVKNMIFNEFSLKIPESVITLIAKRLVKENILERENKRYNIIGTINDNGFQEKRASAKRQIGAVARDFIEFSKNNNGHVTDEEHALSVFNVFLSSFSIDCLRCYMEGTALPEIQESKKDIALVGMYIKHIHDCDPHMMEHFITIVKGQMLANSLLCDSLAQTPKNFSNVTFYLDTPFVIRLLGLEGDARQMAVKETLDLVKHLSGRFSIFEHTYDEIQSVVDGAIDHFDLPSGRGNIIFEMRKAGKKRTDLILLRSNLEQEIENLGIQIKKAIRYSAQFQINEEDLENVIASEIHFYNNKRAIEYDINSIRSVYTIREGTNTKYIENCKAILVTTNNALAKAAFKFGKDFESSRSVSTVISHFSLANIAWLKSPMQAPDLPLKEVLSYAHAALQPEEHLWKFYLKTIAEHLASGKITQEEHELLRLDPAVREDLVTKTLGDINAVDDRTITAMLENAKGEITNRAMAIVATQQNTIAETEDKAQRLAQDVKTHAKMIKDLTERLTESEQHRAAETHRLHEEANNLKKTQINIIKSMDIASEQLSHRIAKGSCMLTAVALVFLSYLSIESFKFFENSKANSATTVFFIAATLAATYITFAENSITSSMQQKLKLVLLHRKLVEAGLSKDDLNVLF